MDSSHASIWIASLCLVASGVAVFAQPAPQRPPAQDLRVIAFDGGFNIPIWGAQRQGYFEQNGIHVDLRFTPNSTFLVQSLLANRSDIALASIDNVIAYQEGQGDMKPDEAPDLFAFMGGDDGFLTLVTAPPIKSFADLRGKTLSVDAPVSGFAFALREMLARNGLGEADVRIVRAGGTSNRYRELIAGKHDGTLLRTPFELLARDKGFNLLATGAQVLGSYVGTVGVARRSWARQHEAVLVGFIRAYREALRWLYEPQNRPIAEALLVANVPDMTPALARQSYDLLFSPKTGLRKDLALDPAGIETVLALRSKYGQPKKALSDPSRYIDRSYAEKAAHGGGQ